MLQPLGVHGALVIVFKGTDEREIFNRRFIADFDRRLDHRSRHTFEND